MRALVAAGVAAFLGLAAVAGAGVRAAAPAWTQFGFGPGGSRFNPHETALTTSNVASLREAWHRDIGGAIWSSAVVSDGVVYIGERFGKICALRAADGSVIWCRRLSGAPAAPAVLAAHLVVRTSSSRLYQLSRATGQVVWRRQLGTLAGGFPPSPTIAGTTRIFVNDGEETDAIDAATGRVVWTAPGQCFSCPVSADATSVYVPTAGDSGTAVVAYERLDGTTRWSVPSDVGNDGAIVVGGTVFLLEYVETPGTVEKTYAFSARSAATGALLWRTPFGGGRYLTFATPALAYGTVFAGIPDGTFDAIDAATGAVRWSVQLPPTSAAPAVANSVVYIAADTKVYAFAAADGQLLWSAGLGTTMSGSPTVVGGTVYIGDDNGVVHAFRQPR
jgi:outer membrane protein assembly factor BamB